MSFTNLLTIAMPCYERKEFFLEALESALNQTVKCKVIVVDNCSSHNFFEMVCREKGVTYYRNETNIGLFPNINRCYELSDTEYVKVLDDDDILSPNYVESFLKAKELYPEIDVYYSDYISLKSGRDVPHCAIIPFGYIRNGKEIIESAIKHNLSFPYMTSVIKKTKALLDVDREDYVGGYDFVWLYSNADQLFFYGDMAKLYHWRIHDGNNSSRSKEWVANVLTIPYVYQSILYPKMSKHKLKNKVTYKAFWGLIFLKSFGDQGEIKKIMNSKNRFGTYFKEKLKNSFLMRVIFNIPQSLLQIVYKVFRKFGITF